MGFVLPDPKKEFSKVTEDNNQRLKILLSLFQLREAVFKKKKKKQWQTKNYFLADLATAASDLLPAKRTCAKA